MSGAHLTAKLGEMRSLSCLVFLPIKMKSTSLLDRQTKYSITSIPPLLASLILSYFCPEHIPPMDLITFAYRLTAEEAPYHDAFFTPINWPWFASWRKAIREILKNLYTARERPEKMHRFLTRAKALFLGSLDNLARCFIRIALGSSGSRQRAL